MNLRERARQGLLRLAAFKPSARLQKMLRTTIILPPLALTAGLIFILWYAAGHDMAVLSSVGPIGSQERNLFLFALGLSLIVVIPVFALLFIFALRYREGNDKATYQPELSGSKTAETIWWLIPGLLIIVLSVVTWNSSHSLDPYRPIASKVTPLKVQVVSLDWKWLFIYPDYDVASVNQLRVPTGTPIDLSLTSDAPMNSLWIPQLGGQIYTMQGMTTKLHLQADKAGSYRGQSANISGEGFAGMHFEAVAQSPDEFVDWTLQAKHSKQQLSSAVYDDMVRPSTNERVAYFGSVQPELFETIVGKYMSHGHAGMAAMDHHDDDSSMKMEHEL